MVAISLSVHSLGPEVQECSVPFRVRMSGVLFGNGNGCGFIDRTGNMPDTYGLNNRYTLHI